MAKSKKNNPEIQNLNNDLSMVKQVKQLKNLKNNIYKWEQLITLSNIATIISCIFFLALAILELSMNLIPLTIFLSLITQDSHITIKNSASDMESNILPYIMNSFIAMLALIGLA